MEQNAVVLQVMRKFHNSQPMFSVDVVLSSLSFTFEICYLYRFLFYVKLLAFIRMGLVIDVQFGNM